jgi:hypothetical protein
MRLRLLLIAILCVAQTRQALTTLAVELYTVDHFCTRFEVSHQRSKTFGCCTQTCLKLATVHTNTSASARRAALQPQHSHQCTALLAPGAARHMLACMWCNCINHATPLSADRCYTRISHQQPLLNVVPSTFTRPQIAVAASLAVLAAAAHMLVPAVEPYMPVQPAA